MLNGFGTVVNALGKRVKPYLPQICGTILWRLNNKSAKVRQQAADLISRIAQVMMTCGEASICFRVIFFFYFFVCLSLCWWLPLRLSKRQSVLPTVFPFCSTLTLTFRLHYQQVFHMVKSLICLTRSRRKIGVRKEKAKILKLIKSWNPWRG